VLVVDAGIDNSELALLGEEGTLCSSSDIGGEGICIGPLYNLYREVARDPLAKMVKPFVWVIVTLCGMDRPSMLLCFGRVCWGCGVVTHEMIEKESKIRGLACFMQMSCTASCVAVCILPRPGAKGRPDKKQSASEAEWLRLRLRLRLA